MLAPALFDQTLGGGFDHLFFLLRIGQRGFRCFLPL
jgi:hypothetical protein